MTGGGDYFFWWCCLKPSWRDMFNWIYDNMEPPFYAVFPSVYDAAFETYIDSIASWLYDWFNSTFELILTTIEVGGIEVEVRAWNSSQYLDFGIFKGTVEYDCPKPCPFSTGPFSLPPT